MNYLPYQDFLYDCEVRNLSPKTIKSYRNMTLVFLKYCDNVRGVASIQDINKMDIQSFMKMKNDEGCKVKYVNSILRTLRAFFVYLQREEYIRIMPTEKVRFLKVPQNLIEIYTDEEVKRLLSFYTMSDYLSARNKVLISLQLDTGIRCTETIMIKNIDMYEDRILINGKGNKQRLVPISPPMYKLFVKYQRIKRNFFYGKDIPDNLFLSRTGRALTVEAIEWVYKKARDGCDINFKVRVSPHTSRNHNLYEI